MHASELRQLSLELDAVQDGLRRYRKAQKSRLASSRPPGLRTKTPVSDAARAVERDVLQGLAKAIAGERALCRAKVQLPGYADILAGVHEEKLALIALQVLFNSLEREALQAVGEETFEATTTILGVGIGWHSTLEALRDRSRDLQGYQERLRDFMKGRNRNPHNDRARSEEFAARIPDLSEDGKEVRVQLGTLLIDLAIKHTKLFENAKRWGSQGEVGIVKFSAKAGDWLKENAVWLAKFAAPAHLPMVVKPRDWAGLEGGGYLRSREEGLRLVILRHGADSRGTFSEEKLKVACEAVNAVQATRWRINRAVFEAMQHPGCRWPHPGGVRRSSAETLRLRRMETTQRFLEDPVIYFPHRLDTRGRAYPFPQAFNPQSDDEGRALLEFADGVPMDEAGVKCLKIHLANKYGLDKETLDLRLGWVDEHSDEILKLADSPSARNALWRKADDKWQFLAAAFEWAGHQRERGNFRSRLPVALDGKCNGFQHLAALGRDAQLGRFTCLVRQDRPDDLYQRVADALRGAVAAESAPEARLWQSGGGLAIDRALVKRPTMMKSYGGTRKGIAAAFAAEWRARKCADELVRPAARLLAQRVEPHLKEDHLRRQVAGAASTLEGAVDDRDAAYLGKWLEPRQVKKDLTIDPAKSFAQRLEGRAGSTALKRKRLVVDLVRKARAVLAGKASWYLAGKLEECFGSVGGAAIPIMRWLQNVAGLLARPNNEWEGGQGVAWEAPFTGFPVLTEKREAKRKKVKTRLGSLSLRTHSNGLALKAGAQRRAIVPNFVHSLDAAHMMRTVLRLRQEGVRDVAVIHDSFAVHAPHVPLLHRVLREEFVKIHSRDLLKEFEDSQVAKHPEIKGRMPARPEAGSLDVGAVLESTYFFC